MENTSNDRRSYSRIYYQTHKEKIRDINKRYYLKKRDEIIARNNKYRKAHKVEYARRRMVYYYKEKGWSDEDIEKIVARKFVDKSNPRVEITIDENLVV